MPFRGIKIHKIQKAELIELNTCRRDIHTNDSAHESLAISDNFFIDMVHAEKSIFKLKICY